MYHQLQFAREANCYTLKTMKWSRDWYTFGLQSQKLSRIEVWKTMKLAKIGGSEK